MSVPGFDAEASLYKTSVRYRAKALDQTEHAVYPSISIPSQDLSFCWGDIFGPFCCICDASSICSCVRPFRRSLPRIGGESQPPNGGLGF
jgi:hypothetical protein